MGIEDHRCLMYHRHRALTRHDFFVARGRHRIHPYNATLLQLARWHTKTVRLISDDLVT